MQKYCLDTSAFINAWRKHYSPDVFPSFWTAMERLIIDGAIVSCHEVYKEIQKREDELLAWCKRYKTIFEKPTTSTTKELTIIMSQFPNFAAQGGSTNAADPWVIAHAKVGGYVVVTYEQFQEKWNPRKPPKIPNVCKALGIPNTGMLEFLANNEIKL
jgi:hypothetical protein